MHRYYCRHVDKLVDSQRQIGSYVDIHSSKYIGYPESCRRETGIPIECSSRFAAIFLDARRTFSFPSAIVPAFLDLPGEGLAGGLQRMRKSIQNRLIFDTFTPASEYEALVRRRCGEKIYTLVFYIG